MPPGRAARTEAEVVRLDDLPERPRGVHVAVREVNHLRPWWWPWAVLSFRRSSLYFIRVPPLKNSE
jgi:hypothetical protein